MSCFLFHSIFALICGKFVNLIDLSLKFLRIRINLANIFSNNFALLTSLGYPSSCIAFWKYQTKFKVGFDKQKLNNKVLCKRKKFTVL